MRYLHAFQKKLLVVNMLLWGLLVMGCGVKALPLAPHAQVPQTIKNLEVLSRRGAVALQWSVPKKDAEGGNLVNLGGFHIWRKVIPVEEKNCSSCKYYFELLVELEYEVPQGKPVGDKMIYWDNTAGKDGTYSYYLSAYTTDGVESLGSNIGELTWSSPLPPPLSLKTTPGDRTVDLSWELPASFRREETGGFTIYRRSPDEGYGLTPLNQNPVLQNKFQDTSVMNGEKYLYVVRSLKALKEGAVEGTDSPEVQVKPEDIFPPAIPSATMVFQSPEGIVVIWEPNLDPDLEGYYIYRRLERETKPTKFSPLLKGVTTYLDKTFSPGVTYYYSVTAIDQSPRHNESDFSQELKVVAGTR